MTLFDYYQEKTKKALNKESVTDSEVIDFLKSQTKPGTKKEQPAAESKTEVTEPQEGNEIDHPNGTTYRFTNGSWLPVEKD